jgi:hypothetical protein
VDVPDADDRDTAAERLFRTHPDLADQRWAKKVERIARRELRARRPRDGVRIRSVAILIVVVAGALLFVRHPWTGRAGPATVRRAVAVRLARPFAETPASAWPDGMAGIVPPAATAVGHLSAAQVASGMREVRHVLVAAHLDPMMLLRHDPTAYLALLAPDARAAQRRMVADPATADGAVSLVAAGFRLLPVPVKVKGSMSFAADDDGNLLVHTNYVFVFAFDPEHRPVTAPWQIDAVQHVAEDFTVTGGQVSVGDRHSYGASVACAAFTQGFLAPAYSEIAARPAGTESPSALYDPDHPLDVPGC